MKQTNSPASANSNSNGNNGDDGDNLLNMDEFLPGVKQKSVPPSAKPTCSSTARKVVHGSRSDSPDSSPSTAGSTQDPIILSDDESAGVESETDYSDLDVDPRAKRCFDRPTRCREELAGNGFVSGTTLASDRLVTNHRNGDNDLNGVVDNNMLWLSFDRPRSFSPSHGSVKYQASKPQMNTDSAQRSTSFVGRHITMKLEKEDFDVFAKGNDEDNNSTRSTKGQELSAVPDNNPASDSKISKLQAGHPDYTQSPQLAPVAASLPVRHHERPPAKARSRTRCHKKYPLQTPTIDGS